MPEIRLKIEDLALDHNNPRITPAAGQQDALQKIVNDQKAKLVKLAESIVERGLSPADRLLVLRLNQTPVRFISLEGNRRIAVFKLLTNPAVMGGLEISASMKTAFERLAKKFDKSKIEPISCFELASREESRYWVNLRHNGGHDGAGLEGWLSLAKRRFDGTTPVLQVLELVTERAGLSAPELAAITDRFPTSTLERFLENKSVRKELGLELKGGKLISKLPADEIAKPLKKIVLDLATKATRVNSLMKTDDMLRYLRKDLGKVHLPDMGRMGTTERSLDDIPVSEFTKVKTRSTRRKPDPSDRREVVPRTCKLNVTQNRVADIFKELRTLKLDDAPNSIAVLLRVFLELSVDYYLQKNGVSLSVTHPGGKTNFKSLDKKLEEVVALLVSAGVPSSNFSAVTRSMSVKTSPLHPDLLHRYVHDQFQTPVPRELAAAWDHGQPLFEKIWP